jgi:hypothetical protein
LANPTYRTPTPGPLGPKLLAADYNPSDNTQALILYTEAGTACYLWVSSGKLYIKTSGTAPSTATDGTVVGTQT